MMKKESHIYIQPRMVFLKTILQSIYTWLQYVRWLPLGNHQSRPNIYNCGACGRDYQSGYYLSRHTQKRNCRSLTYFRCALCGVCTNSRAELKYHLSSCHKNVLLTEFDAHIIEIKPTLSKFVCNLCSCRYESREQLRIHKNFGHCEKS